MRRIPYTLLTVMYLCFTNDIDAQKIFDTHIHGARDAGAQIAELKAAGVYKAALSTSYASQRTYTSDAKMHILKGLMIACPEGKVPYSGQSCFGDNTHFPDLAWVESQIKEKQIDFIGEVLSQYYGISPSDNLLLPYYALAEKYGIPVGIHTGLAGPDHGSPNFKVGLGSPILLEGLLQKFKNLKVWIMHCGAPFLEDTIAIMGYYTNVYADISAISNPGIFRPGDFYHIVKRLVDAGLEDRLMFGSDNGDINKVVANVNSLDFLTQEQKEKIFFRNAETFFSRTKVE